MGDKLNFQTVDGWYEKLHESFNNAFGQILDKAPNVVGMLVVLVVGYIVARVFDRIVSALSDSVGLQTAAERSGLLESMRQVGINRSVSWIVGRITFWLTMCVFLTAAFNILDLPTLSQAMETLVGYIPKLLVATVVVVIGLLIATFLRGVVATSADRVGISYAEHLANGVYYVSGADDVHRGLRSARLPVRSIEGHDPHRLRRHRGRLCPGLGPGGPGSDGGHPGGLLHPSTAARR